MISKKINPSISWKIASPIILASVFCATVWVSAAFTNPTVTPANYDQDFNKNILGSNNANNIFGQASSTVTANDQGSIIERLEWIRQNKVK
jgi:hypothetical protein